MNRFIFLLTVVVTAGFYSCTKQYTCSCTATDETLNAEYTETLSKADAIAWCDGWQESGVGTAGWLCTLSQ